MKNLPLVSDVSLVKVKIINKKIADQFQIIEIIPKKGLEIFGWYYDLKYTDSWLIISFFENGIKQFGKFRVTQLVRSKYPQIFI